MFYNFYNVRCPVNGDAVAVLCLLTTKEIHGFKTKKTSQITMLNSEKMKL